MLFGRLRVPFERLAAEPRERSGIRLALVPVRGDSPRRPMLVAVPSDVLADEFEGLDRLDREELDEE